MKECLRCHKNFPLSEFGWRNKEHTKKRPYCSKCQNLYRREHYQANKKSYRIRAKNRQDKIHQYIINYLNVNECVDCGEEDLVVLEFDHNRDKKYNVSEMIRLGKSIKAITEEIAKCDIRCANCHKRKTAKEQGWYRCG